MFQRLKLKKKHKVLHQRVLRLTYLEHFKETRYLKYLARSKKIPAMNKFFVANMLLRTTRQLKSVCPYYGRSFVSKKYGLGRFKLAELFSKGRLTLARSY